MKGSGSWRLCKTAAFFRRKPFRQTRTATLQCKARERRLFPPAGFASPKPRGTVQAASRGDAGQDSAWFWKIPLIQSGNAPLRRPCRQLPLQGSLSSRRRRRGAAPGPASILPGRCTSPAPASIQRLALVRNRRVRTFQAPRDGAGSVQRGCRARLCRFLKDTPDTKRQCTPQAALPPAPLTGEPFQRRLQMPPCKGRWMRRRRRRRGAAPGPASILPDRRTSPAAHSHNVNSPAVSLLAPAARKMPAVKTRRALFPWSGSQITERRPCWRAWPYG